MVHLGTVTPQYRRVYKFGLFEADLDQGTLARQGSPVKLQEQPFRILALLLEARGDILTRDDLRRKIWPEGTFVEFDGSLNTALMKLRAALNDSADNPVFIETVPRKGYRFIAPIELSASEERPITTAVHIASTDADLDGLELPLEGELRKPAAVASTQRQAGRKISPLWWEA